MKVWGLLLIGLILLQCGHDPASGRVSRSAANTSVVNGNYSEKGLSGNDNKPVGQPETKMTNDVSISMNATAEVAGGRLVVNYDIENPTNSTVYLWDQMIGYKGGTQVIDEDGAYVFLEEPGTVRLVRANLPLPNDIDVSRKEIPFSRAIQPKGKASGKISLEIPVVERSPFYPKPPPEDSRSVNCTSVHLMIGWLEQKEGMQISERTVGGTKVLAIRGTWPVPYHRIIEQKIPVAVEMTVYKTPFDRSLPMH